MPAQPLPFCCDWWFFHSGFFARFAGLFCARYLATPNAVVMPDSILMWQSSRDYSALVGAVNRSAADITHVE